MDRARTVVRLFVINIPPPSGASIEPRRIITPVFEVEQEATKFSLYVSVHFLCCRSHANPRAGACCQVARRIRMADRTRNTRSVSCSRPLGVLDRSQ